MQWQLNNLEAFHWLWAVAAMIAMFSVGSWFRRRDSERFASPHLHQQLFRGISRTRRRWRTVLLVMSATLVVTALLDPRWGVTYRQIERRGIDVYFVLDISRSMLAEDATPNRLQRARQFIRDLVASSHGDRIGLITFAGVASIRCPLTLDYGAFDLILEAAQAESAERGGTLLGDAIRLAAESFMDDLPDSKAIIVLSDGEDHGSFPLEAASALSQKLPIPVFAIGLGDDVDGARIPIQTEQGRQFLTYNGEQVWTKMQPQVLRDVALATGGAFVPAGTSQVNMSRLYEEWIRPRAQRDFDAATVERYKVRYQWFAGGALVLLLIATFMGDGSFSRRSEGTPLT